MRTMNTVRQIEDIAGFPKGGSIWYNKVFDKVDSHAEYLEL
jgi:hypothetical protein